MAIDTEDKRRSFAHVLPVPDSSINAADRTQITANLFRIEADEATPAPALNSGRLAARRFRYLRPYGVGGGSGGGGSTPAECSGTDACDLFTDSDSTSLDAHAMDVDPDGNDWTENNGAWEVQSNRAEATGANPGGASWVASCDPGSADIEVESTVFVSGTGLNSPGLILRMADIDNLWLCQITENNNDITIYERTTGTWTLRATTAVTIDSATEYNLKFEATSSDDLTGTLDDTTTVTFNSSTHSAETRAGIRATVAGIYHDTFKATNA